MLPSKDEDYIHHIEHSDYDETLGACSPRVSLVRSALHLKDVAGRVFNNLNPL